VELGYWRSAYASPMYAVPSVGGSQCELVVAAVPGRGASVSVPKLPSGAAVLRVTHERVRAVSRMPTYAPLNLPETHPPPSTFLTSLSVAQVNVMRVREQRENKSIAELMY
jgi:hypothetical protein